MADLLFQRLFPGFGPTRFAISEPLPPHLIQASRPAGLRAAVRQECPRRPGVYGMINEHGELIYVGKAKCLRTRLLSYFRSKSRDPKAGRIVRHARAIAWEHQPNEFAALHRELELIRAWRPRWNVQGQPRRGRRTFVCLGRRPAPYAFLSARPPANALACFGPVPAGELVREAVRRLNDLFQLRDCPQAQEMCFADQAALFPEERSPGCLRYDIGTCLGPCAALCTRPAYGERVREARAFLAGLDLSALDPLDRQMAAASAALDFERAAGLRDRLTALRWLCEQLDRLRRICERSSFIYVVKDLWYLIHGGRVVQVTPAATHGLEAARAGLDQVYEREKGRLEWPRPEEMDFVFLLQAWFRKHPDERAQTLEVAEARAACLA